MKRASVILLHHAPRKVKYEEGRWTGKRITTQITTPHDEIQQTKLNKVLN